MDMPTWSVLHVRLNTMSRSAGVVARGGLEDKEREPPMRRDHCRRLVFVDTGMVVNLQSPSFVVDGIILLVKEWMDDIHGNVGRWVPGCSIDYTYPEAAK